MKKIIRLKNSFKFKLIDIIIYFIVTFLKIKVKIRTLFPFFNSDNLDDFSWFYPINVN